LAAQGLWHSDSWLGRFYRRMSAKLGPPQALTATAHKLARIIYTMLRTGRPYVEPDPKIHQERYRKRAMKKLQRQAKQFGLKLVPDQDLQAQGES